MAADALSPSVLVQALRSLGEVWGGKAPRFRLAENDDARPLPVRPTIADVTAALGRAHVSGTCGLWCDSDERVRLYVSGEGAPGEVPDVTENCLELQIEPFVEADAQGVMAFWRSLLARVDGRYGYACLDQEFLQQNADLRAGARVLGVDRSRCLPGVYWLNYFGKTCVRTWSRSRLLRLGGTELGEGVVLQAYPDPFDWDTDAALRATRAIRQALGVKYFFEKAAPGRRTVPIDL